MDFLTSLNNDAIITP